jgi:hypothetical protein
MGVLGEDDHMLTTHLSSLAEFASGAPDLFVSHQQEILRFIVQKVLKQNGGTELEQVNDWVDFDHLEPIGQAKILGLRILVNRLCSGGGEDQRGLAGETIKLLRRILENDGELLDDGETTRYVVFGLCLVVLFRLISDSRQVSRC